MNVRYRWYHFADGYRVCVRSLDAQERKRLELRHGKLLYIKLEPKGKERRK